MVLLTALKAAEVCESPHVTKRDENKNQGARLQNVDSLRNHLHLSEMQRSNQFHSSGQTIGLSLLGIALAVQECRSDYEQTQGVLLMKVTLKSL